MKEKRNFFDRIFNIEKRSVTVQHSNSIGLPYAFSSAPLSVEMSLQLSAVYRCVEVISDAIATQDWKVMEHNKKDGWKNNEFHPAAHMMNVEPNTLNSKYTFMKVMIAKMLLNGNAYAIIHRNGLGDPEHLELVIEDVKIYQRDNGRLYYRVGDIQPEGDNSRARDVDDTDMIHLMNFTYDGRMGLSTLRYAATSMGIAQASEATAKGFFSSGSNSSGIISSEGKLTKDKADKIKESWRSAFTSDAGTPAGGVVVMEDGLNFEPVTINPKDAQMLESRQFNVIEICRFFGVSPSKVFDDKNLTYTNIEAFQLGFLTDTISPLNAKIEAEFNRKLLRPSKRVVTRLRLDIESLLRADITAKANYISKMFQSGAYTVNEARKEAGNPESSDPNADIPMVQVNMQPISKIGQDKKKDSTNSKKKDDE